MRLVGKRALVTGGTRGIGKAVVEKFIQNGCKVVFTYFSSDDAARAIEKEFNIEEEVVWGVKADAANPSETEGVIKFAHEKMGGLDILVNNAGITKDNLLMRMTEADFDAVVDANLKGVFLYTKHGMGGMLKQRHGRIINISSVVGVIGNAGQSNYAASKAGVIGFSKSMAKELASRNITVNVVAPGFIETDMTGKLNDQQKEQLFANIPLKKFGKPEYIADACLFLASNEAEYITGQVLCVDGGMVM